MVAEVEEVDVWITPRKGGWLLGLLGRVVYVDGDRGSGMSIGWRQQFGDVVVSRRGISGWVVRACECASLVMGNVVWELVVEIVLAISMRGVFGGMPMAVINCWGDLGGE